MYNLLYSGQAKSMQTAPGTTPDGRCLRESNNASRHMSTKSEAIVEFAAVRSNG